MKLNKILGTLFFAVCLGATAQAQDITGTVTDDANNPLPGASVYWADTNVGVASNIDGTFRLHRVKGYDRLVTTFLGYENDTLRVDDKTTEVKVKLRQGVVVESVTVKGDGGHLREGSILKTENISFAGLCKMACCNLAESFENSASVTVGYSDAVSGARQIKMLGLAGTYTQVLDENRAIMRGLSAPYGLGYTPGMWLNSIQVSKGISSVTAGHEAITGQINLEHRKPTDDERLFLNLYFDSELRPEINLSSAMPVTKDKRLSTVILAHGSMDTKSWHHNNDYMFRDLPLSRQFDIANRWLYQAENGMQVRWGVKYINDNRLGGQMSYRRKMHKDISSWAETDSEGRRTGLGIYGSEVRNQEVNAYFKMGMPVGKSVFDKDEMDEQRSNFAIVADFDHFRESAYFGADKDYFGRQNMANLNAMYVHYFTYRSSLIAGVSASSRWVKENLADRTWKNSDFWEGDPKPENAFLRSLRNETEVGAYLEYTYTIKDKLSIVAGLRDDYNFYFRKNLITPRAHIKWNITPTTVLRGSVGMGYRPTDAITDNIGILATGRRIKFDKGYDRHFDRMEEALTAGGSLSQTISTVRYRDMTISFDYFRTQLFHSVIADQEYDSNYIHIYSTSGRSYTNSYQVDLTWNPVERLDIFATFRWTDSKYTVNRPDGEEVKHVLVERPLVGQFKTLLNIQYATNMRKWVFDVTAQLNGRSRIPTQTGVLSEAKYGKMYPMFYAQISRRIKHWDIYLGCENIGNYVQKNPILAAQTPYSPKFNSACVWGPLMGRKFYIGVRFNLY